MKKIQKRIFSLFLAVVMAFSLLPATAWAASPPEAEDLAWVNGIVNGLNDDITDPNQQYRPMGTLAMSPSDLYAVQYQRSFATETTFVTETIMFIVPGSGAKENYCEIPEYENLNDTPWGRSGATEMYIADGVTGIGDNAFNGMTALEKVVFQDASDLTSIGTHAFSGDNRAVFTDESSQGNTLNLSNVTTMGEYAFSGCSQLTSVTLNGNITAVETGENGGEERTPNKIPSHAFSGTGLTSIEIPAGTKHIGDSAFSNCPLTNLTTLTLPDGLETIGDQAFYRSLGSPNNSLQELTIPSTVTSIGAEAFYNYQGLQTVTVLGSDNGGSRASQLKEVGDAAFGDAAHNAHSEQTTIIHPDHPELTYTGLVGTDFYLPAEVDEELFTSGETCYTGNITPVRSRPPVRRTDTSGMPSISRDG